MSINLFSNWLKRETKISMPEKDAAAYQAISQTIEVAETSAAKLSEQGKMAFTLLMLRAFFSRSFHEHIISSAPEKYSGIKESLAIWYNNSAHLLCSEANATLKQLIKQLKDDVKATYIIVKVDTGDMGTGDRGKIATYNSKTFKTTREANNYFDEYVSRRTDPTRLTRGSFYAIYDIRNERIVEVIGD
jgi:hypothetical protein